MILQPIKRKKVAGLRTNIHISFLQKVILFFISIGILLTAVILIWISTFDLPNFNDFQNRVVLKSTQLYDKTGTILLYDIHKDYKRSIIPFEEMGDPIQKATIAIEDDHFYSHIGIRPKSILRAVYKNLVGGNIKSQGGSTITQQIVKNTLLSSEKTLTRKIKEVILALKIEKALTKDQILAIYLNESPYGGNIYGVEQAAQTYFSKRSKDLTIAEAAYIASIPQRPTYFSPYGKHVPELLARKDLVLERMKKFDFITEEQYIQAKNEVLVLSKSESKNIKAPHFVFYVQDYLIEKYGEDVVNEGGLKVITTLDYELQKKAEALVEEEAKSNKTRFNAENMGMVGIDPRTSQILFMVGSRDYFDTEIDGQYNIATAKRQPGSAFKPLVYALAFEKGYLPETVLYDLPFEFSASCSASHVPLYAGAVCYAPNNYTKTFQGTVSLKKALGSSLNIPAVQMLYMVGIDNAISFAKTMGISTLDTKEPFGLSLVLGGAEVQLIELVNAYGVFANGGIYRKENSVLSIQNSDKTMLEEYKPNEGMRVMSENTTQKMSDVLSDNTNRLLVFGVNNLLRVVGHNVAVKTGTTNNFKDAWILGYTPSVVIGAWAGNNDARPMVDKTGSTIAGPAWNKMMTYVLDTYPEQFPNPPFPKPAQEENYESINPVLRGTLPMYASLLTLVDKNNPRGGLPSNPSSDPLFKNWEEAVANYYIPKVEEPVIDPSMLPTDPTQIQLPLPQEEPTTTIPTVVQ